ncbi:hypothetical protein HIM_11101 [Hirsutella minnesotensis 3608]|uniref:Uncharacterized protein n=1 Tax=Hirsutella minnesotensis 3608 TaxID=1043627 RepID=A0A0F8A1K6_9HYPO|nr:hypothetical protein HIM_11101 [Hirsutella minnesotensis 3608]
MGDLSNCPLSDRDKELLEKFWTELENDRMERCTRCQETWFDMGLKDDICKRCIAKDKNKKEDEPWFFSAENQLDFGLIPVFLPELTKVEEMLIAPVHVFVNVMQVRGQQYKYRGHIVHFLRDVGKVGSHEGASKNDAAVLDKVDDTVRHWGTREEAADWAKAVEWWTGKCAHCVGRGWRGQQVAHNMRDCESGGRQQLRKELGEAIFQEGSRALGGCSDCAMPRDFCNAWMKGAGAQLRGTRPYWYRKRRELESYAYNLSCPSAFITFSPADLHWRSLYQHLPQFQDWQEVSEQQRMGMSSKLLRDNPHIAA